MHVLSVSFNFTQLQVKNVGESIENYLLHSFLFDYNPQSMLFVFCGKLLLLERIFSNSCYYAREKSSW